MIVSDRATVLILTHRLAPRGFFAQDRLEHLAAGIARHRLLAKDDVLRHFEIGEMLASECQQITDIERLSRSWYDDRADLLAHHLIRHADDRDFKDRRV